MVVAPFVGVTVVVKVKVIVGCFFLLPRFAVNNH